MGPLAAHAHSPWLSLGEASRLLGITPATLRRWADHGDVAAFVTPGGHRRFPRSAIEALVPRQRSRRPMLTGLTASASRVTRAYLRTPRHGHPANDPGIAALSDAERADLRDRGRRLLLLLLDHLNEEPRRSSLKLAEAEDQATQYGRRAATLGASLSATLEAFVRFRGAFTAELAAIARRRRLDVREATALLVEGEGSVDRLLVALTSGYTGAET
ncbi:MAG TPA: helix-turn-helix domain-containing protein [Candidatus Dormibacteraeota bacterium]|nr:helix-turn-helix domain-containing protein [Candidatus Dormibacteraeota bacterium]